jgi:LmbE family N-acetylglucosaminyl deacetylase
MTPRINRIIILSPHTDDGEFGCGGTIARFSEESVAIFYIAFSSAEESVGEGFPKDILKKEVQEATKLLGIPSKNLCLFSYPVRKFPQYRQDILEDMVRLNREIKPDLVLLPSPNDTHQDHVTIAQEGFRAFKKSTMLGYEVPWNNLSFNTTGFVSLEEKHLERKIRALECYKSQAGRDYANEVFIRSLAKVRGVQIGVNLAEVFEVIRFIIS